MTLAVEKQIHTVIHTLYQSESRRILATLIRLLGDFELAEEAMQDAFAIAIEKWPLDGIPANPRAWLVSTGRFKAIDTLRRRSRFDSALGKLSMQLDEQKGSAETMDDPYVKDDSLRLIFICCHPALSPEARIALTLREVCGLTTEEIARAFLTTPPTLAQRIVRAKAKIRDAGIPYEIPEEKNIPERLDNVLHVIYLVFNEGYSASTGKVLTRADLSGEAIRLGKLLLDLLPEAEVMGLLALMLLQESRRSARTSSNGDLVLLEDQNRSLWNQNQIEEGIQLLHRSISSRQFGYYTIQAAIAAEHALAYDFSATNWKHIVALYNQLVAMYPSPVIELNRAVAVSMRDGADAGLRLIDAIFANGDLHHYHLAHSAKAELCRRLGKKEEALLSYKKALDLASQEPERRFLERRLQELAD